MNKKFSFIVMVLFLVLSNIKITQAFMTDIRHYFENKVDSLLELADSNNEFKEDLVKAMLKLPYGLIIEGKEKGLIDPLECEIEIDKIRKCLELGVRPIDEEIFYMAKNIKVLNLLSLAIQVKNINIKERAAIFGKDITVKEALFELKKRIVSIDDFKDYDAIEKNARKFYTPKTISDSIDAGENLAYENYLCDVQIIFP